MRLDCSNKVAGESLLSFEPQPWFSESQLKRSSKLILAISLVTVLTSVDGCGGKIRYPSYYLLNVPAPLSVSDRPKPILGSVAVREFSAPGFLRVGPIAYRQSPEQLDFYSYHRWAEDPRRVVTAAIVREMQARGLFQSVDIFDGRGSPECLVTGTLDHFEEVDQGANVSIEVTLSARLINLRTGRVLWQDTLSKTAKVDRRSIPGMVAEMSQDLGNAVEQLGSSMQDRLSATSLSLSGSETQ
jgi:ABC-type uncharacterized transport system auxiliary subunit